MPRTNRKTTVSKARSNSQKPLIYVIAGKDESMVSAEAGRLIHSLVPAEQRETSLLDADKDTPAQQIFDELRTLPFLADQRVVVVKKADDFVSKNRSLLEKYFENPSPTGILILTVGTWKANTKLAKKLPKVGKLITIAAPKLRQLPGHLSKYAQQQHNKKLAPAAANLLVELLGEDLPRLQSEVDKLALYAVEEKAITADHVNQLSARDRFFNAFEVIDAVTAGRTAHAIARMRAMFAHDRSAEYTFVGAFAWHFRKLFNAKVMQQQGAPAGQIASKMRVWYNKPAFFNQLRAMSLQHIGRILTELAEIDFQIKTGQSSPRVAAERFVMNLR